jgi:hypothetical protein
MTMYQDINGNQFESYAQASRYYGGESDAVLQDEADALAEEYEQCLATQHGFHAVELYYRSEQFMQIPF